MVYVCIGSKCLADSDHINLNNGYEIIEDNTLAQPMAYDVIAHES